MYKTRKDENFVEYFKIDRADGKEKLVKVPNFCIVLYVQEAVTYCIKWVTTSWTDCRVNVLLL